MTEAKLLRRLAEAIERHAAALSVIDAPLLGVVTHQVTARNRNDLALSYLCSAMSDVIDGDLFSLRKRALAKLAQEVVEARSALNLARADHTKPVCAS